MKVDHNQSSSLELDILGDKWTLLILRDMLFEEKSSFSEFKASSEKIASNILTDRLAKLDAAGFVIKTSSIGNKVKYRYSLTDKAIDLLPVFVALFSWAEKHGTECSNPIIKRLITNDSDALKAYSRELKKHRDATLGI